MVLTRVLLLICCWAVSCGGSVGIAAEAPVAKVVAMRGIVTASNPDGSVRPLQRQDAIMLSDTIRTGENGRIQCLFNDQTLVSLGPRGEMKVQDFAWRDHDKTGRMKLAVKEGVFEVLGGLITKHAPQNFATETLPATIGIRGSSFAGETRDDQLKVVFLSGKGIFVANAAGSVEISTPQYGTTVSAGSAPTAPVLWSSERLTPLERLLESSLGAGSEVRGAIINQSDNRGAANIAIGAGNRANLGSVAVEQSHIQGAIVNQSDNRNATNVAIGEGNVANLGSVDVKYSQVEGAVLNQTDNQGGSNVAVGSGNKANTGSIVVK